MRTSPFIFGRCAEGHGQLVASREVVVVIEDDLELWGVRCRACGSGPHLRATSPEVHQMLVELGVTRPAGFPRIEAVLTATVTEISQPRRAS